MRESKTLPENSSASSNIQDTCEPLTDFLRDGLSVGFVSVRVVQHAKVPLLHQSAGHALQTVVGREMVSVAL